MSIKYEDPIIKEEKSPISEWVETHPAYGQVSLSRPSGHTSLYGSQFKHQHFISLRVQRSEKHRSLSRDWYFGREVLIEIDLSEAQWSTLVSSVGQGGGVPCTLRYVNKQEVPRIPTPPPKTETFKAELDKKMASAVSRIEELGGFVQDLKISQKAKDELKKKLISLRACIGSSTVFIADQFQEYMEEQVSNAKSEIEAHVGHAIRTAGVEAINSKNLLTFTPEKDDGC